MNIFIYNPNSRGGNYEYAIRLAQAYELHQSITRVCLILPANADYNEQNAKRILLPDVPKFTNSLYSKLYFLYRSFINPLKFFLILLRSDTASVVFNDFDQATSLFWAPLMKFLKKRIIFSVILHDPDRDQYFKYRLLSELTMKKVMSVMDIAFYHETLPEKKYYREGVKYVSVPHGIYKTTQSRVDDSLMSAVRTFGTDALVLGALGNVRKEKNYAMIIRVLKFTSDLKLVIAGLPANTSVSMTELRMLVDELDLRDRVMIIERYLSEGDLEGIASVCDGFILYYSNTFKSQSGLLNLLAPFKKTLLVCSNDSPLSQLVKKYNLGLSAVPDSPEALKTMLQRFANGDAPTDADWQGYFNYASWDNHVNVAVDALQRVR